MTVAQIRFIPLLLLVALAAAACGGNDERSPRSPGSAAPTDPPNLVTRDYIEEQARDHAPREATVSLLEFWRDIQYLNLPKAYGRMTEQLQAEVRYQKFSKAFNEAQPSFLYRPRLQSVESTGSRATIYLLLQQESRPSPKDPPLAFNLSKEHGRWKLATDPRNVLGTSVGAEAPASSRGSP